MNLQINETRKSGTHSEEEIAQLTLEEGMGELRRAQYILSTGHPIQKYAIYSNIHNLQKQSGFSLLFNYFIEDLITQDEDTINVATKEFLLILKSLNEKDKITLLQLSFHFIRNYNNKLQDTWYDLFEQLNCYDIHNAMKLIDELTNLEADSIAKQRGAKLLEYLPQIEKMQLLCMDKDAQVRLQIVKTISMTYYNFTPEKFSSYLKNKISELIYDYHVQVRMASIEMLFQVQTHLLDRENIMIKYFFEFLGSQNAQIVMSKICGKVLLDLWDLKPNITKFIQIYKSFEQSDNEEIRINWAYNFAGIIHVFRGQYYDQLCNLHYQTLQFDKNQQVRSILMASLPDIISVLGLHKIINLIPIIRKLLSEQIIQQNLYAIVYALWPSFDQPQLLILSKTLVNDIILDLSNLLQNKPNQIILEQLIKLHEYFQQCESYLIMLQPLLKLLHTESYYLRILASQNLAYMAYHDQYVFKLKPDKSTLKCSVFRLRINYIDFIAQTIDLCSKRYFSYHNFINVLQLAFDKIFDVRIRLGRIMKKIQAIILDDDEPSCIMYNKAVKHLQKDKIIDEILKQNESKQFFLGDDQAKQQKEYLCFVRVSADDIDTFEDKQIHASISPLKNNYHSRKRSSITRQPVTRSQPNNSSFTQKLAQIQPKQELNRRTSVPGRKVLLKVQTQFKPKLNQQRLRK